MIYLSKLSPNLISDFTSLTPFLIARLVNCTSPNILESLLYPFFFSLSIQAEEILDSMAQKHLNIFVDKWIDYVEYGNFKNRQAKDKCLECLLKAVIVKLTGEQGMGL